VYILDRTDGTPLIGIDERPVPQEPLQATSSTQPYPRGDSFVPHCPEPIANYPLSGCIFTPYREIFTVIQPHASGGSNWSPSAFSPQTSYLYVSGAVQNDGYTRHPEGEEVVFQEGARYWGSAFTGAVLGSRIRGTFTAMDMRTNTIAWQVQKEEFALRADGALATAGGLVFVGMPDGHLEAYDARTGDLLWQFQTGAGANAPPVTYEVDGQQYVAIAAGGGLFSGSQRGDMLWAFSLGGTLEPLAAPRPPPSVVTFPGALIATDNATIKDYAFGPQRITVPAGSAITWTNTGDLTHTATDMDGAWSTGAIDAGARASVRFDTPGTYAYACTIHTWMMGQVVVTPATTGAAITRPPT
jgi:alcohol dehydrogenase (cytochrome c)